MSGGGTIYEYQREMTVKLEQITRERDEARILAADLTKILLREGDVSGAYERQLAEALRERDEARAEVERLRADNADLLAHLDAAAFAVPQGLRDVAEAQREACAAVLDGPDAVSAAEVRATPLVTEGESALEAEAVKNAHENHIDLDGEEP